MVNFQLVSDIHLEWEFPYLRSDKNTVLIIAGDLAEIRSLDKIKRFYDFYSDKFHSIIEVLGNHSFYHNDINCIEEYRIFLSVYPNVHLLDNDKINICGTDILGTTLWSDFENKNPISMWYCSKMINDFNLIEIDSKRFRPEDALCLYYINQNWLIQNETENCIVVTHHAPSFLSVPEQYKTDDELNGAYYSNLDNFILNSKIKYWFHGHMHTSCNYRIGGTKIVCNPKGYGDQNSEFNNELKFS
jgi:Icc-related predicted phosphoesterase